MKIYSALQIGEHHLNHCEDYLFVNEMPGDKIICAVMDGCTMGNDSYFVSTLVGKLLRKIIKVKSYQNLYDADTNILSSEDYLKDILKQLFHDLSKLKNQLLLEQNELLTTLIILVADKTGRDGTILAIGDGVVNINGQITEFDQDNKPDYIGFHLNEVFETWYSRQTQKLNFNHIQDISIATDGISLFTKINKDAAPEMDPVQFLMHDATGAEQGDMLYLKLKKLEHVYGLKPGDDLAVIRIIA